MELPQESFNWSIQTRISALKSTESMTDVQFIVGDSAKKFNCHKLILAAGSEVFQVMFYGRIQEGSKVIVPDITAEGFEIMLEYLYSDEICIKTSSDAFETAYAAKKYIIKELFHHCERYLMCEYPLNYENACCMYEKSCFLDMKNLKCRCINYISRKFLDIIHSESFLALSKVRLEELLALNVLEVASEFDVVVGLLDWAEFQCQKSQIKNTKSNMREILDDLLEKIRFPTLSVVELQKLSKKYDFIDIAEEMAILLTIALPATNPSGKMPTGFGNSKEKRSGTNYIRMQTPSAYRHNDFIMSYSIPGHQQKATLKTTGQVAIIGVVCSMIPRAGYAKDQRYLNVEVSAVNCSTKFKSKATQVLKAQDDEQGSEREVTEEIWFEDPPFFDRYQLVELSLWVQGEGVQLPQLTCEHASVKTHETTVDFKVAKKTMDNKDFIVKEIMFM